MGFSVGSVLYVSANFNVTSPRLAGPRPRDRLDAPRGRRRMEDTCADADPASRGALQDRRDRAEQPPIRRGASQFPEDRGAPPELLTRAEGAVLHRRGVLSRGRVRQSGKGVRRLPGVLSPARDRTPSPVPPRDELLRPDEARRAGPGADPEGAGPVREAGKGVPAEPLT